MTSPKWWARPSGIGLLLGLGFGLWNLLWTRLYPLAEDSEGALFAFYGPMFAAWALTAFFSARQTGHTTDGIKAGVVAALVTFFVLDLLMIVRVNLFLEQLTARTDWQNLMARFPSSGFESLRSYINCHYISQAPFTILVASAIGVVMAVIGAAFGSATRTAPQQVFR